MRSIGVVFAVALLVAGCSSDSSTVDAGEGATTSSAEVTSSAPAESTAPADTAAPASTTTLPGPRVVEPVPADLPPLLVVTPDGIGLLGEPPIVPAIVDEPGVWVTAVPDGQGGLVYAAAGDAAQIIWWWQAGAPEARLVSFKPGRVLHDVGTLDGRLVAVVSDDPDPLDDDHGEYLQLLDLENGSVTVVGQVADRPFVVSDARFSGGGFVVSTSAQAGCGELFAVSMTGQRVSIEGVPVPPCSPLPHPGVAIAPDGASLAVLEQLFLDDHGRGLVRTDLVVYRAGAESLRLTVAGTGDPDGLEDRVAHLDYDGRWAVIRGPVDVDAEVPRAVDAIVVDTAADRPRAITIDAGGARDLRFAGPAPTG